MSFLTKLKQIFGLKTETPKPEPEPTPEPVLPLKSEVKKATLTEETSPRNETENEAAPVLLTPTGKTTGTPPFLIVARGLV